MTLIVETGAGVADANAFDSLENIKARWTLLGRDFSAFSDAQINAAIIRATAWLSVSFSWQQFRTNDRDQPLEWPRTGVVDHEGYPIESDEVPVEVRKATAETAWQELNTPFSLTPVVTPINQKVLIGVKGITWKPLGDGTPQSNVPVLLAVRDLIGPLLKLGGRSRLSGMAVRS